MGKYVYCITKNNEEEKMEAEGIDGVMEINTISYKNLSCWVSDTEMKDYEPTDENVEVHETIVRRIMENETVLPVAYSMVFKSKKILRGVMQRVYWLLQKSMKEIDGKVELGVKVILDKETDPKEKKEELKPKAEQIESKKKHKTEETPKKEENQEEKPKEEPKKEECAAQIFEILKDKATNTKKGKLFSDRLLLNASFLVDRDNVDKFSEAVRELKEKYNNFKIQYTGPWPPYNFVDIRIMGRGGRR